MDRHIALTRAISPAISRCLLTHLTRVPIDVERARRQHDRYEQTLADLGCDVRRLAAGEDMPDSVFIEDTAVVLDEAAIVCRPGAESRRAELPAVAEILDRYRPVHAVVAPATIDGGDVLVVGRRVFIGLSTRTNHEAVWQMQALLRPLGYQVEALAVSGCLHLKSAVTALSDTVLLVNRCLVDPSRLGSFELIDVHADEPLAANALRVADVIVFPEEFPRTRDRLASRGFRLREVEVGELAKAEGAVTCCSLVFHG